jgi:hypothetical protein
MAAGAADVAASACEGGRSGRARPLIIFRCWWRIAISNIDSSGGMRSSVIFHPASPQIAEPIYTDGDCQGSSALLERGDPSAT